MKYILLLFFIGTAILTFGQQDQTEGDWALPHRHKMVSINTTPLLVQLIPFNRTNPLLTGPYNAEFHVFSGESALHFSLGFFVTSDAVENEDEELHFNFRIGTEKRRWTKDRWSFLSGGDLYFSAGGMNLIGETQGENESAFVGYGRRWSIEYAIQPSVRVSIEAAMVLGLDLEFGELNFMFIPPVAVNLNFVIPRK